MLRILVVSATRFNLMALMLDKLEDVTDSIQTYRVAGLLDGAGNSVVIDENIRWPLVESRPSDITTEIRFAGGSIHLTVNKETGNASLTSSLKDGYTELHLEIEVVTTNHNRRPAPNLPMGGNGEFIDSPSKEIPVAKSIVREDDGRLTVEVGDKHFVKFPAEWGGMPPREIPQWVVKRGEAFMREFVKRTIDPSHEKTEWILSVDAEFVNTFMAFGHGVTTGVSLEDFVLMGAGHFSFRQRAQLENDPSQRHLINYDIIIQYGENNDDLEILLYERTKFSGEQRLANGRSIGIGGHIEKGDAIYIDLDQNHPDILETIRMGVFRERMEEVVLISRDGYAVPQHVKQAILTNPDATRFSGFLCDNEDPKKTGTYHLGIVSFVLLPRGIRAETTGRADKFVGCFPIAKVLEEPTLERWSRIVGEQMASDDFSDLVGVKQLELHPAGE